MSSYSFKTGVNLSPDELLQRLAPFAHKFQWFMTHGYAPHTYQALFHTLSPVENGDRLCRFRHLVAGRRGGKTMSAAWEVLYYSLNPDQWHLHRKGVDSNDPLHIWVLAENLKVGRAALREFRKAVVSAGLVKDKDYTENRGDLYFEFQNDTLVEFKTAVDPQSLRGAGLDILWIDEAAFIPSREAWDVTRPALANKLGGVICTTTPKGKNWYYDEWFSTKAKDNPQVACVEYRSIDNPYFPAEEWLEQKQNYHPLLFKQEYEAAFDSMAGLELPGEWLTKWFYEDADLPRDKDGRLKLEKYIGVDPAISLADSADRFVITLIGVSQVDGTTFLLDLWAGRIPFAEQLQIIADWHLQHRPMLIGIEGGAYQTALVQQAQRLPNLPPIIPMLSKGKKFERILTMSPLFRTGRVRVKESQRDFIDEWLNYDSTIKNPKDDTLDAVEIALRTAGALMPVVAQNSDLGYQVLEKGKSLEELIRADLPGNANRRPLDEHLGVEW